MRKRSVVIPIIFDTYIAVIKNSVGANIWRNFYADVNGSKKDIMRDGDLSCAFFVSSILALFRLASGVHGTVNGLILDLDRSGWKLTQKPEVGDILVWEAVKDSRGETHRHVGFYIGDGKAVSNSSSARSPAMHHWTFGEKNGKPVRKIDAIYRHPKLSPHSSMDRTSPS